MKRDTKDILIIGGGYVGLTVGVALASFGNNVIVFDSNKEKRDLLKNGKVPIEEPGLVGLLEKHKSRIVFTDDFVFGIRKSDIVFVTVNTDFVNGRLNLSNFNKAFKLLLKYAKSGQVIVIKSTVPIGTTDKVKAEIRESVGNKCSLVINPEFLREGHALEDFLHPDRIIIGAEDEQGKKAILGLYESIDAPKIIVDFKTAEMIKYSSNAFLSTKISFINEISDICELFGVDVSKVTLGIGLDKRIGNSFLNAGIGFGGSCLPKDLSTIINTAEQMGYTPEILKAVRAVNLARVDIFTKRVVSTLGKKKCRIAVWGLAFKGGTNDIRNSPAVMIIEKLLKLGYKINIYDPSAVENARRILGEKVSFFSDHLGSVKGTDALLVLSDSQDFLSFNLKKTFELMKKHYFFDGRNLFEPAKVREAGFLYFGAGRADVDL
ncbi:MAG: UDP-glucose dehydrogenase family protein [Caldisericaceae bacterium]